MKTLSRINILSVLAIALMVSFAACSSVNNEVETISDEDLEAAAQIVATTLSDEESGMMSSMYDALSDVDDSGITYGESNSTKFKYGETTTSGPSYRDPNHPGGRNGRGVERNFVHEYDSTTGIHSISFTRTVDNERISKSISVAQEIIYTDLDGSFVAEPRLNRADVNSISHSGTVTGTSESRYRSSNFTNQNDYELTGLHESVSELTMNGTHKGAGSMEATTRDSIEISRSYEVNMTFENVVINKDTVLANGSLENATSGTLTYTMVMSKTIDGVPEETELEGTIDLEADGTAILKFKAFTKVISIYLETGEVLED